MFETTPLNLARPKKKAYIMLIPNVEYKSRIGDMSIEGTKISVAWCKVKKENKIKQKNA